MTKLAKTRGMFLKAVLQELEGEMEEWSQDDGFENPWVKGYFKALEDVWERMKR